MIPILVFLTESETGKKFLCNLNNTTFMGATISNAIVQGIAVCTIDGKHIYVSETIEEILNRYNATLMGIMDGIHEFWTNRLQSADLRPEQSDSSGRTSVLGEGAGQERSKSSEGVGGSK